MSDLTYLSLGAGVQSSALYVMSCLELRGCPKAEVAIFADTQSEPPWVYEQIERLRRWGNIPIETVTAGNLGLDAVGRGQRTNQFVAIPAYTLDAGADIEGRLRRQCTREYKLEPIRKKVRELLGLKFRQRAVGKVNASALIGISLDEIQRCKPSRDSWITNTWPLVDAGMRRRDCVALLLEHGFPETIKSACVFCPYHDDDFWRMLKSEHREQWNEAIRFDREIRDKSKAGAARPIYIHRTCQPLEDVDFDSQLVLDWDSFTGECEGMCGV